MKDLIYKNKIILYIFAAIVLLSPTLLRLKSETLVAGTIPYYFLQKYPLSPVLFKLLPLAFGAGIVFLLYLNMRSLKFRPDQTFIGIFLLLLSVPFIYVCTYFTDHTLLMFLLLLGFYLFQRKNALLQILSFAVFVSTIIFGVYALVVPVCLLAYSFTQRKKKRYALMISAVMLAYVIYHWMTAAPALIPSAPSLKAFFLESLVLEFGAYLGFGLTMLILAFFGFLLTWRYKFRFIYIYLAMLVLFILSARYLFFIVYLNLFIIFFAGYTFQALLKRKWDIRFIGFLAIIALICSFLFSAVSFADREAESPPTPGMLEAFETLSKQPRGTVLSVPEHGFWIGYYSGKEAFSTILDTNQKTLAHIFQSRSLDRTSGLLQEHNVSYILIDDAMKTGGIWSAPDQGLLFLLPNKEHFKNIYNKDNVEIWQYIND